MASSDDEAEAPPKTVSNYDFVDDKDEPVSFCVLPTLWGETENPEAQNQQVFLRGTADNGLQKIYKPVSAWRFDISNAIPELWVLSKENNWIKLQKPRKIFEDIIRTILITVHSLHHVKRNPDVSGRTLWDHLSRVFSLYEIRPSQNDLVDHMSLISEAVKRDDNLGKSQFLLTFLEERPMKRQLVDEEIRAVPMSGFIVDDTEIYNDMNDVDEDGSDEDEDLFDSVCAICDNGGEILCCEGKCLRSFHATEEDGEDSHCETLGYSREQVEAIENFVCKNCEYKQQQCFICGKLGSSDKSRGAEVFLCANATCGHYYHPHCVSKLEHKENEVASEELRKKVAAGESFTCPIHKCCVCKQGEDKKDRQLQFAVCRRCPKSYHRKCLPRKIAFQDIEEEGTVQRAWEGLLPNRILIYCLKHEMDEEIGTPVRDHIVFPGDGEKKTIVVEKKKKRSLEVPLTKRDKFLSKKRNIASGDSMQERFLLNAPKLSHKFSSALKEGGVVRSNNKFSSGLNSARKEKLLSAPGKSSLRTVNKSITSGSKTSLGDQLYEYHIKGSGLVKQNKGDTSNIELNKAPVKASLKISSVIKPALDADSERRILAIMRESASSITMEDIIKKQKPPSTYAHSSKYTVDKSITIGKVEGAVEAVRTALQKLDEGCSIEDARAVCEPEIVNQIFKWKNKLKVYLAPFLHGMRYTSFGRHFTKVEKLQEIVDKLHWYVQNGDTIVDFCCGANDFSLLMRKKLEEMGKKCSYRNFDVIQPKNDFNFEKRDWMTVRPNELPAGSQLIMGLNPPFGVKAALANKFVDKALEFKPKLLILIVPPETERLDKKKSPYDLVWEDALSLSGKSFYLPGSVDTNDKQMDQWNSTAPPLYLWSRHDWTDKHSDIASKYGHIKSQGEIISNLPTDDCDTSMVTSNLPIQNEKLEVNGSGADHEDKSSHGIDNRKRLENLGCGNDHPDETRKRKHVDDKNIKSTDEKSEHGNVAGRKVNSPGSMDDRAKNQYDDVDRKKTKRSNERLQEDTKKGGRSHQSPSNLINDRPSVESHPKTRDDVSQMQYGTARSGLQLKRGNNKKGGRSHQSPPNLIADMPSVEHHPETREDGSQMQHGTARSGSQTKQDDKKRGMSHQINNRPSVDRHPETREDGSQMQYGTSYSGSRTNTPDDVGRRYNISGGDEACAGGDQRWYRSLSPLPEFAGRRSMDEQFLGHTRDRVDTLGYNRSYMSEFDRDYSISDIRSQIHLYGRQQDPDPVPAPAPVPFRGHNPGYDQMNSAGPYRNPIPDPDVSYRMNAPADYSYRNNTNTSAMQRYAPRLDEMNNYRMNPVIPEPQMPNRSGMYDPRAQGPGYQPDPMGFAPGGYQPDPMAFPPGYQPDPMGFAPGFQHPFPHKNSAGWLDD